MPLNANVSASATAGRLPLRDPAWRARVLWGGAALVALWPLLVATEFKPWLLWDERSAAATRGFVAAFFPPRSRRPASRSRS